jgi:hypothetical protein
MSLAFYYPLPKLAGGTTGNNWSFELGLASWTPDSACWQVAYAPPLGHTASVSPFEGHANATFDAFVTHASSGYMTNDDRFAVGVGGSKTMTCRIWPQPNLGAVGGKAGIRWYDAGNVMVSDDLSALVTVPTSGWQLVTVTATRPVGATQCGLVLYATNADTTHFTGRVNFDWLTLA